MKLFQFPFRLKSIASRKEEQRMKNLRFKGFRYSPGYSDMRGGRHWEELRKNEDGAWTITCEDRESLEVPTVITVYAAADDQVADFDAFLRVKKAYLLADRKDSDDFVTDYSPWGYCLVFERTEEDLPRWERNVEYKISEYKVYSKADYELIREMRERFRALRGEKISETSKGEDD